MTLLNRIERLEEALKPKEKVLVVFLTMYYPTGEVKAFKNDRGFYCARLPGESLEDLRTRAGALVREHPSSIGLRCISVREEREALT
jgi:hypothetical protein